MLTAARATSSSASDSSSSSKASRLERQKLTMPRTTPLALIGAAMSAWMPKSMICWARLGSWARQPVAVARLVTSSDRPAP